MSISFTGAVNFAHVYSWNSPVLLLFLVAKSRNSCSYAAMFYSIYCSPINSLWSLIVNRLLYM